MTNPNQHRKWSEREFQSVFDEVRRDINELQLHDQVFTGVVETLKTYPQVGINYRGFFTAFYSAMRTSLIIGLGRIYDPEGTGHESCTLVRCLQLIRDNLGFFSDDAIKARLSDDYRPENRNYLAFHRPDLKRNTGGTGLCRHRKVHADRGRPARGPLEFRVRRRRFSRFSDWHPCFRRCECSRPHPTTFHGT